MKLESSKCLILDDVNIVLVRVEVLTTFMSSEDIQKDCEKGNKDGSKASKPTTTEPTGAMKDNLRDLRSDKKDEDGATSKDMKDNHAAQEPQLFGKDNQIEEDQSKSNDNTARIEIIPPLFDPKSKAFVKIEQLEQEANDLKQNHKYNEALEKLNEAINTGEPSALLLANRGDILYSLGRFKAAVRDCNSALMKNPDR